MTDNETDLLQRVLAQCEKADMSATAAIGVLTILATPGQWQSAMNCNETDLFQRVLKECEKTYVSAAAAIGVITVAATLMTSQAYDLTSKADA